MFLGWQDDVLGIMRLLMFGWGVILTFVVDTRQDDVLGVTRLLHVALRGFRGVLGCDV